MAFLTPRAAMWVAGTVFALLVAAIAHDEVRAATPGAASGVAAGPATGAATRSSNVYTAGPTARPGGPVDGDLVAAGGRVIADQPVRGDALLIGGSVDVRAPIGDDLRAAGGDVNIEQNVGGELHAAGGTVTLLRGAAIGRDATVAGGSVRIDGRIGGDLWVGAQRARIDGEIAGDVQLQAQTIELGPGARIRGNLRHVSETFRQDPDAVVDGPITKEARRESSPAMRDWGDADDARWGDGHVGGLRWGGSLLGLLGLLAAGAVFVLLFPRFGADAPQRLRAAPWLALAIGFGVIVGVPVLVLLLMVTVLGIPLGVAVLAAYPAMLLVGYLTGALFIGGRLRIALAREHPPDFRRTVGYLALALLALTLISWLPVAGPLAIFLTTIAGIGACVLEWHLRRQAASMPPSAPQPPADAIAA